MENIEKENVSSPAKWKSVVVVGLLIGIIAGCVGYIFYLRDRLADTIAEKELVEARLDETVEDLEFTNSKSERQSGMIKALADEITKQDEYIADLTTELEEYKTLVADEDARWMRRYEEYDTATEVWTCMKSFGWNDIVCAGIMGNLMAETGGSGRFNLDWDSNTGSGYGLIQWTDTRRAAIKEKYGEFPTVKEQMQFVYDELYGTNGVKRQVSQGEFNAIMDATTPESCAFAFASYFERCDPNYREVRREYARWAYNYFAND